MKIIAIIGQGFWHQTPMMFGIIGSVKELCMKLRHTGHCLRATEVLS